MEPPIENWYRLAEAIVKGLEDADELDAWRQWAYERARRVPVDAPKALKHPSQLWLDTSDLTPNYTRKWAQARHKQT